MGYSKKLICVMTLLVFGTVIGFSQTKSIETIEAEIAAFQNPQFFSVLYERDLTTVKLSFDLREDNKSLKKPFKEFSFGLSSIFTGPGIEGKPYRSLLCIIARSKKFHFASNRDLSLILDGESIDFGSAERTTTLRGRKTNEKLCWEMNSQILGDLAKSNRVNLTVGSRRVKIPILKSKLFRDYSRLLITKGE